MGAFHNMSEYKAFWAQVLGVTQCHIERIERMVKKKNETSLMDVLNLSKEWDTAPELRERLRVGGDLLHPESSPGEDNKTCVLNKELLTPMLERMIQTPKKSHPPIDGLREEVAKTFNLNKRNPLPDFDHLQKIAWRLRYMVCFVKAKARRGEVSRDILLHPGSSLCWTSRS